MRNRTAFRLHHHRKTVRERRDFLPRAGGETPTRRVGLLAARVFTIESDPGKRVFVINGAGIVTAEEIAQAAQELGLKAYRQMIFERFPRTGIPYVFESLSEYDDYLKLLIDR